MTREHIIKELQNSANGFPAIIALSLTEELVNLFVFVSVQKKKNIKTIYSKK